MAGGGWGATARRVLVTRAADQADALVTTLRQAGIDAVRLPTIEIEIASPGGALDEAARQLDAYAWVVITSANGARAIIGATRRATTTLDAPSWAAIGPMTRSVLEREGIGVAFQPSLSNGAAMAAEVPIAADDRVLVVRGDLADEALARVLRTRGAQVDDVIGYWTREGPQASRSLLRGALAEGPLDAVVFTSASTVRGLLALAGAELEEVTSIPAVCIGPETAAEAARLGFRVVAVAATRDVAAVASATVTALAAPPQEVQ